MSDFMDHSFAPARAVRQKNARGAAVGIVVRTDTGRQSKSYTRE